jgi:hypothetical protein
MRRTPLLNSRFNPNLFVTGWRFWIKPRYQFAGALFLCSAAYYYKYKPRSVDMAVLPHTLAIKEYCKTNGMNATEITSFISLIDATCSYLGTDHPKRTIDQIIQQGGSLATIATFGLFEAIAFFKLAPLGVTAEEFAKHKKLFIMEKDYSLFGFKIILDTTTSSALGACEYLLKSGSTFDDAVKEITEIEHQYPGNYGLRLNALSDGLPTHYAMTFTQKQISLYLFLKLYKNHPLSASRIAVLKIDNNCNACKLISVLEHLLITHSWDNTVRIINGDDLKTKSPALFGANDTVPHADYINKVLYSRIFRDKARKQLNLSATLLGDDCVWFNDDDKVEALVNLVKENGVDEVTAIKQLRSLNKHQIGVIIVGGSFDEAQNMYTDEKYADTRAITSASRDSTQIDLKKFRQAQSTSAPRS